jgi:hypothetical protein
MESFVKLLKKVPTTVWIFIGCFLFYFIAKSRSH